jgi:hypothetical protein
VPARYRVVPMVPCFSPWGAVPLCEANEGDCWSHPLHGITQSLELLNSVAGAEHSPCAAKWSVLGVRSSHGDSGQTQTPAPSRISRGSARATGAEPRGAHAYQQTAGPLASSRQWHRTAPSAIAKQKEIRAIQQRPGGFLSLGGHSVAVPLRGEVRALPRNFSQQHSAPGDEIGGGS